MGSIARTSSLERFKDSFKEVLLERLNYLIDLKVLSADDVEVNYHVKSEIQFSNEEWFPIHWRWATEEEDSLGEEVLEEGEFSFSEFLKNSVVGQTVKELDIDLTDRDDEIYLLATLSNEAVIEIPLGYDPENGEIYGIAENLLTEEEIQSFYKAEHDYIYNR